MWFYHIFNKPHCRRYRASGRKWKDETFSSSVDYFAAQYNKDLDSGALAKVAYHQEDNRRHREKKRRETGKRESERRPYCHSYKSRRLSHDSPERRIDRRSDRRSSSRREISDKSREGGREGRDKNPASAAWDPKKDCPLHGAGHNWGGCSQNPKNKGRFPKKTGHGGQYRNKGSRREDSHLQDYGDESVSESERSQYSSSEEEEASAGDEDSGETGMEEASNALEISEIPLKKRALRIPRKTKRAKRTSKKSKVRSEQADDEDTAYHTARGDESAEETLKVSFADE